MNTKKLIYIIGFSLLSVTIAYAQKIDGIGNEEVVITKDRKIELPPANRIFEKIPAIQANKDDKQMKYTFLDRKPTNLEIVKISPTTIAPDAGKKNEIETFNNHVSIGAGNFGRLFGELYLNSGQDKAMIWGIHAKHNSTSSGPVLDANSATQNDHVGLSGKYMSEKIKLTAAAMYDYKKYYFYGYKTPLPTDFNLENTMQRLNSFRFDVSIENMNPEPTVDYTLKTSIKTTRDLFKADELDWGTNFNAYFPILEKKLVALLEADAYVSQYTDIIVDSRNLFRVRPSFKYNTDNFSGTIGYRAVNETDDRKNLSRSKGFPTLDLTYKFPGLIYAYAGLDGDIIRNTWGSFLQENPYLDGAKDYKNYKMLQNTEKTQEYYAGVKGDIGNGVTFNLKGSYANYKNMSFFNNWNPDLKNAKDDSTRFKVLYDSTKVTVINVSGQLNYQPSEMWRTYVKADYYNYSMGSLEKPFHRPNVIVNWGNTLIFANKLVFNAELYYYGVSYAKNFEKNITYENKGFVDLNTEFNYIFSNRIQAFVKLNNLLNTKYQRFLNYPQQGLNFLVGLNFSF